MPGETEFDIQGALEQSTSRTTLEELAKRGIKRVKVLNEPQIKQFIEEAVQRIISTRTTVLSEQERQKIIDASRKELDRLVREHTATKEQAELAEQSKNDLIRQVENLQQQLAVLNKLRPEEGRKRFEEGVASLRPKLEEQENRLRTLEQEAQAAEDRRAREVTQVKAALAEALRQAGEGAARQAAEAEGLKQEIANQRRLAEEVANRRFEEGAAALRPKLEEQENRLRTLEQEAQAAEDRRAREATQVKAALTEALRQAGETARVRFAEGAASVKPEIEAREGRIRELEAEVRALVGRVNERDELRGRLDDLGRRDDRMKGHLETLFQNMVEGLDKKLQNLRIRAAASGEAFEPGSVSLENLFKEELESNLAKIGIQEKSDSGGMDDALAKLKKLRGS
ncbi:MAG: hypothetical protein V1809_13605 [Planctomycetota bacterium]